MDNAVTYKLKRPVQFGEETIPELLLKPSGKSMRDLTLSTKGDGSMVYEPYALAKVGIHMAGRPNAVLDMMHPADVMGLTAVVLGFFDRGPETGTAPSPS